MTKTIATLKDILTHLFEIQEAAWFLEERKWKPTNQALETYRAVSGKWEPITLGDIEYLFGSSELVLDFSRWGKVLYLKPLEKNAEFVPVLSLTCTLNKTQSIARLRIMLVCLDMNGTPYGMGFRMETPESMNQNGNETDNGGIHDFHHAQLIRKFCQPKLDDKLQVCSPDWLPTTQPSFPLSAKCPVMLMLCLILTLYGKRYYDEFLLENEISGIEPYKTELKSWINQGNHVTNTVS